MIRKIMIGLLAAFLLAAAGFSIANITKQNTITADLQDKAIAAKLKESEQALVDAALASSMDNTSGMGMGHQGMETDPQTVETIHDNTIVSGTVEILTSGVLNVTTADETVVPVWIGNGALTTVTDFSLESGNTVTVEGFWSGSGNFMAQTLTNEDSGAVLDLTALDLTDTNVAAATTGGGQGGYG